MPASYSVSAFGSGSSRTACLHTRSACVGTQRRPRPNPRQRRSNQIAHVVPLARLLTEHLHSLERISLPPAERQKLQTSLVPLQKALVYARRIATAAKSPLQK